jgi:hypothetical protein
MPPVRVRSMQSMRSMRWQGFLRSSERGNSSCSRNMLPQVHKLNACISWLLADSAEPASQDLWAFRPGAAASGEPVWRMWPSSNTSPPSTSFCSMAATSAGRVFLFGGERDGTGDSHGIHPLLLWVLSHVHETLQMVSCSLQHSFHAWCFLYALNSSLLLRSNHHCHLAVTVPVRGLHVQS